MNFGKKGIHEKQHALNSTSKKIGRKLTLTLVELAIIGVIGLGVCGAAAGIGAFKGILACTPSIRLGDIVAVGQATVVYDAMGNEIDQYVGSNSNRLRVESIDELPKHLGLAFVALEDERFYQHNGIDYKAMVRSGYEFLRSGATQGASTITQQLLKNTVFTSWTSEGKNMIKKIKRKIQEQNLALEITKYYEKDDILLEYMNAINLGQNTLGVEAASKRYFGKSASELTISESAVIASITQNPSWFNPIRHPENNETRRLKCLKNMKKLGFITEAEFDEAIADTEAVYERIGSYDIDYRDNTNSTAGSYFSDALYEQVKKDLVNIAGYSEATAEKLLTSGGLRIDSTMDPYIQAIADEEFANPDNYPGQVNWLLDYALSIYDADKVSHNYSKENMTTWFKANVDKNFNLLFPSQDAAYEGIDKFRKAMMAELGIEETEDNYVEKISLVAQPQAAMVIEDQTTGYVVALVGGRGVKEGRRTLNRATSTTRSPGSTFKVIASFAPALDSAGMTLATVYNDAPFNYDTGRPVSNWYKTGYRGICSIRKAIEQSMNIIAVKNLTVIGPQMGYDYCLNFGFTTLVDREVIGKEVHSDIIQPLALGGLTHGVTVYEMNAAYASIANLGTYVEPKLYSIVRDADGNVILDNTEPRTHQVLKQTTAYLLTDAMTDVVTIGTGTRVNFNKKMAIAGKTGTSTDTKDVWFAGYTPYYTCTVWTGYDNNVGMDTRKSNDESAVSKNLWKAVMKRIHEDLPNEQFVVPEGLVTAQVCRKSGLVPIPGVCDETDIITEIFAEGTEPYESCNVHYEGHICNYDWKPASAECPFKVYGRIEVPLIEDASLEAGSTMITENEDGTQTITKPPTTSYCQHNYSFYMQEDYETILLQQQWEINRRNEEAAAQAALQQQQAGQ